MRDLKKRITLVTLPCLLSFYAALTVFAGEEERVFFSGFENDSTMVGGPDLIGYDYSTGMDWVYDLDRWESQEGTDRIGYFTFDYGKNDTGTDLDRKVELAPGPENPENRVLKYWIKKANNPISTYPYSKGRIQSNLYNNDGFENFTYSVRWYVPTDLNVLKDRVEKMPWMIVFEFWNNVDWRGEGYEFRINVNLTKEYGSDQPFRLRAKAQKVIGWIDVWDVTNDFFEVPTGQWMTVRMQYIVGNDESGRFYMDVKPDGGARQVIFDITNFTHHPDDPAPNGVRDFNPIKMYCHKDVVDLVRNDATGKYLHFFWDDFEMWIKKDIFPRRKKYSRE